MPTSLYRLATYTLLDCELGVPQTSGKSASGKRGGHKPSRRSGPQELFCVCQQPMDDDAQDTWVACDRCEGWCHTQCVGVDTNRASSVKFVCPDCKVSCWCALPACCIRVSDGATPAD